MKLQRGKQLQSVVLSVLLLVSVASIILPRGSAYYYEEKTNYDRLDKDIDGGGTLRHEARAQVFLNGTMWLEVGSGMGSWAVSWGKVIWNFTPPRNLYNVRVSADFVAYGQYDTYFASADLWFMLNAPGESNQYHDWFGNYWSDTFTRNETVSIDFGTMYSGTMYQISATIKTRVDNQAWMDLESNGPTPLDWNIPPFEGYGRVTRIVVEEQPSGGGGGGCVLQNTQILMASGKTMPVQTLKPDDEIMGYDVQTETLVKETVTSNIRTTVSEIISINHGLLYLTATDQPIYTDHGWIKNPQDLKIGWRIFESVHNTWTAISSLETLHGEFKVYDLRATRPDTFIANGLLLDSKTP